MSYNVLVTELEFEQAYEMLSEKIADWESRNQLLLNRLSALGNEWQGVSGSSYKEGSGCICANSFKKNSELTELRAMVYFANHEINFKDMSLASGFEFNARAMGALPGTK